MRKLKLQVQMTIDGFVAGPKGELDWMTWTWDDELINYVSELTDSVDTILLGRKMTDGFISHWANVTKNPDNPEYSAAKKFVELPKIVFSRTLNKSIWDNTVIAKGDYVEYINGLKEKSGKDIIVYGGADFVSSLVRKNLIDEYHLFINPSSIGTGMTIFNNIDDKLNLKLIESNAFECGIVMNKYIPTSK
jgi:dihydrofolate reductase